jgi:antitoxin HicB
MWYELKFEIDNGAWLVTSADFPELTTFGETTDEALRHGLKAIEEAIAARIADSVDIPLPLGETTGKSHFVQVPSMVTLKAGLYMSLRNLGMSRAELQRRMSVKNRETVDRLFRLDHNTRLSSIEEAFKAIEVPLSINISVPEAAAA